MRTVATNPGLERLRWLIRIRWLALAGVSVGVALAARGMVPGVNVLVAGGAVCLGVITNLLLAWRWQEMGDTDEQHVGQALLDTGALTLVVWSAGGAECPFIAFYVFPILLAALLGGRDALVPTALATAGGLGWQILTLFVPVLQVGRWDPMPPFAQPLQLLAVALTVIMAAYFAARFTGELRRQARARERADAMLRVALQGIGAGVEFVRDGVIQWGNAEARTLLGDRVGQAWRCPDARRCPGGAPSCPLAPGAGKQTRCELGLPLPPARAGEPDGPTTPDRIYEMLTFPLNDPRQFMALYLDRTAQTLADQQLTLTERLASLGRTVQGVAHEMNTPLATIQTLSRDVGDAVREGQVPDALRDDLTESAELITAEVGRLSRITHALLGRAPHLGSEPGAGTAGTLEQAVDRAVAVVFTHERTRVRTALGRVPSAPVALDPLVQVLVNLLQNARDADPEGPIAVTVVPDDALPDGLCIEVRDRGPGIPADVEDRLFEPFFTTKPPGRGTGLGLYTSFALVRDLGGRLTLENHPEGGALARVHLPASTSTARAISRPTRRPPVE